MPVRRMIVVVGTALAVGAGACGGDEAGGGEGAAGGGEGAGGGQTLALGQEAVVTHTVGTGAAAVKTKMGITPTAVRKGTHAQLEEGGFQLDPDEKKTTPYYVDVTYENQGTEPVDRQPHVSMEDGDGNLISSTTIIDLGGKPFEQCARVKEGKVRPGRSYESCTLFLVPEGITPAKVSFLPNDPGKPTEFVYWEIK